ncbi:2,3,4,5-tetrahydropyridine-2,6-dicarboxylate N-succinyltransferase [Magnetofaba australis]|uniref:Putative 2,3,4,5-tetrahydropyridine-2,6-dicarboxylate N-succinyltransferase n=1 Tax=Magnetofaba australis IT-1 TaxID=1434232 RepID=A0A1Y2K0M5_9PROT|nr:hypothetical protein [Magnetofaba australis]OSM01512.1 putative 2,3,4,5-tetrahydropyridine-2,6-dicarboxylate N-succinyltransferase [Magnetofaba australis IT-1]
MSESLAQFDLSPPNPPEPDFTALKQQIEAAWPVRERITPDAIGGTPNAIRQIIPMLDDGVLRVVERNERDPEAHHGWITHWWLKKAIILYGRLMPNQLMGDLPGDEDFQVVPGRGRYFDNWPLKFSNFTQTCFEKARIRVTPPAMAQKGCYIAPGAVLNPCFAEIGAQIGEKSVLDDWSTVGACAYVGARVTVSKNAHVGGGLSPIEMFPAIVEDEAYIGSHCKVAAGVVVQRGAILVNQVAIERATPILDLSRGRVIRGLVPANAVVMNRINRKSGLVLPHIVSYRPEGAHPRDYINKLFERLGDDLM